ncbi:MAG: EscN/YscN/HrcN family type III secretion system ATPase, partial [Ignavibacteria bacterium]|nr:EscN/YscN/HrcN family type III secretion system ATPase [Ignavibacteria bacterium]
MISIFDLLDRYKSVISNAESIRVNGKVLDVIGLVIVSAGPNAVMGEICSVIDQNGKELCKAEVVGFKDGKVLSIAIGEVNSISPACEIKASGRKFSVGLGKELLGRVIDGLGNPMDGKGD